MARMDRLMTLLLIIPLLVIPVNLVHAAVATLQITPSPTSVELTKNLTVNLTVTGVTNLAVWEFRLFYLRSILNCTSASKGPFLEENGSSQFFNSSITNSYNATHGCILLGSTLVGQVSGVNGSGTLATITFQAISSGSTPLHFDNDPGWNFLLDATPPPRNLIAYVTVDGVVEVTSNHDVAVNNVTSQKTVICRGCLGNITVAVANLGEYAETFNVTVYATANTNTTSVESKNVTLSNGNSANVTLTWNTTGFAFGNYTISAYAWPVLGETNVANNNFTGSWIYVSLMGDLTGDTARLLDFVPDGRVDMKDVSVVAKFFGQSVPPAPSNCDVTGSTAGVPDGKIDMRDVGLVAKNFGDHQ